MMADGFSEGRRTSSRSVVGVDHSERRRGLRRGAEGQRGGGMGWSANVYHWWMTISVDEEWRRRFFENSDRHM